ncbi:MAG: 4-hydroxy-3-methylbut-2-enyl diphosphate reductase, partial [Gammaproteobacteria bacterium]
MQIVLANPRGFCAGVDRAIEIVDRALEEFGAPIYVRHEVVHNRTVVDGLKEKGAVFIEDLTDVPVGSYLIFSAHGVSKHVQKEAEDRNLTVFDATCPLVTKVHMQVAKHAKADREVILIGHAGHPEVEGTMGQYEKCTENGGIYLVETPEDVENLQVNNPDNLAYVTQTTLSMTDTKVMVDALKARFTAIQEQKKDDFRIIIHIGHNSLPVSRTLAKHARDIHADAIAMIPPNYYKIESLPSLVEISAWAAEAVPCSFALRLPPRELLPALHDHVAVRRVDLHQERPP